MNAEKTWSWDGSAEGLVGLAARAWSTGCGPEYLLKPGGASGGLFEDAEQAQCSSPIEDRPVDPEAVLRMPRRLRSCALRIWMSGRPLEKALLAVAARCRTLGESAFSEWDNPDLRALAATVRAVVLEEHRLKGFARFSMGRDGIWRACLEPDFDVLPALVSHFEERFGEEPFMLVDLKRDYCIISDPERIPRRTVKAVRKSGTVGVAPDTGMNCESDPGEEAALWRRYFSATENPARRNSELQRKLLPLRYRSTLTEFARIPPPGPPGPPGPHGPPGPSTSLDPPDSAE
ncbi:MAG: TIGR03915 family putative DNA repair protein [Rectinemataceae bacterium]